MNNYKTVRTAVIGVGSMGRNHARIYKEISNLIAVVDPNEKIGREIAHEYGVTWFSNYKELKGKVDAVSIAVPTSYHELVSTDIANLGIHILVEKPLSINVASSKKIIDACNNSNVVLSVGHVERYNPVISVVKDVLSQNNYDNLHTISCRRFSPYPGRISDVGVLFDLTIHDVDIISSLFDDNIASIFASGGSIPGSEHEDYITLVMNFENGAIGICQTNWVTPIKIRDISITTSDFFLKGDLLNKEIQYYNNKDVLVKDSDIILDPKELLDRVKDNEPLKSELLNFLDSIISRNSPKIPGKDGLRAVSIVEAALKSLNTGKIVKL